MKQLSLRLRIILLVVSAVLVTWLLSSVIGYLQINKDLREVFDSQQLLFAKRLASLNLQQLSVDKITRELPNLKSKALKKLEYDDDALAFAIFDLQGRMVINDGENGRKFSYDASVINEKTKTLIKDYQDWRILWLVSFDSQYVIAVGQELDYRDDISEELFLRQMVPWLFALPILILLVIIMVSRELKPLKTIANTLRQRKPDDAQPLIIKQVPKEISPFVDALNVLFTKITTMLTKERRFISDAAHELRTPLTALKVQAEVAQMSDDNQQERQEALTYLSIGIDRASRLVEQLLALSKLDSLSELADVEAIDWPMLIESVISEQRYDIEQNGSQVSFIDQHTSSHFTGNTILLSLLLRNLIDNALRYAGHGCQIVVTLANNKLYVADNGKGLEQEYITRLGERFFRPPGQEQIGSGLGLSIVNQIADFHQMKVTFYRPDSGGFGVQLSW